MEIFLKPTEAIDSDNNTIIETAESLTYSCKDNEEKAVELFYFVRDQIHYSVYMVSTYFEDFIASTILARKKGYCVQKALLLAALARAVNIPSRLAFAKIKNHRVPKELVAQTGMNVFPSHGYTQLFLNNRWVSATPAFDKELCKGMGVPVVEFDGKNDAILSSHDLEGRPYIEYIEKYEPQADLPFEWLKGRLVPIWGEKHAWLDLKDSKGHRMPSGYIF
ncbi:MAG: transglutaminase family protein [Syntrophorhabdaceae bacterium]|nr:transglutaminase family protein [Syntrophorhabdaceae bacterium]